MKEKEKNMFIVFCVVLFSLALFVPGSGIEPQVQKDSGREIDFQALDSYIKTVVKDLGLTGLAISIVQDQEVVFEKGYGYKDITQATPVSTNSLFNIASCTKAFTAAAIGLLVEQDKIDWDDRVIDVLPGFRLSDDYITSHLTIRDLLCHRSGLETFAGDLLWYETSYDSQEIVRRLRYIPIKRQFGREYGYQNCMYIVAGQVIEKVSGKPWETFLVENIFQPLDMQTTKGAGKFLADGMDIAKPHVDKTVYPRWIMQPNAAASLFSCVSDMSHWMSMLLNDGKWKDRQVLASKTVAECFTPQIVRRVSSFMKKNGTGFMAYGLGWGLFDYYGEKVIEHSGAMPGYISRVTLIPGQKLGIVILTNSMNSAATVIRYKILDMLLGRDKDNAKDWLAIYRKYTLIGEKQVETLEKEREKKRIKRSRPSLKLEKYTGSYEDKVYGKADIRLEKKKLVLTLVPTQEVFTSEMEHWHYDTFRVRFKDSFLPSGLVTFSFDAEGNVTGFKIDLPNPDFHFKNLDFKKI